MQRGKKAARECCSELSIGAESVVSKGERILFVDAKLAVSVKIDDQCRPN